MPDSANDYDTSRPVPSDKCSQVFASVTSSEQLPGGQPYPVAKCVGTLP